MCEVQASFTVALPKVRSENYPQAQQQQQQQQKQQSKSVLMSFVDNLWSMEVSGGADQMQPLTVVAIKKNGLARRAGIKVGDVITHINGTPANNMTLLDAQLEIQDSGKSLKLTVKG
jgi:C-terminal processing protease CtpA/Prc